MREDTSMGARQIRVLFLDDEPAWPRGLERRFARYGIQVTGVASVEQALERLEAGSFDVVLVDLELEPGPGGRRAHGVTACRQIAAKAPDQVMALFTAHDDARGRKAALRAGVRACLSKNTEAEELAHQVRALVGGFSERPRAPSRAASAGVLIAGDISLNLHSGELRVGEIEVEITHCERHVLALLLRRKGTVVTLEQITALPQIGGTVDSARKHVPRMRKKCRLAGVKLAIETTRGEGYIIRDDQVKR